MQPPLICHTPPFHARVDAADYRGRACGDCILLFFFGCHFLAFAITFTSPDSKSRFLCFYVQMLPFE